MMQDKVVRKMSVMHYILVMFLALGRGVLGTGGQVMHIYTTQSNHKEITDNNVILRCAVKCNLEENCQSFVIDSNQEDPCVYVYQNSSSGVSGEVEFYKESEGQLFYINQGIKHQRIELPFDL